MNKINACGAMLNCHVNKTNVGGAGCGDTPALDGPLFQVAPLDPLSLCVNDSMRGWVEIERRVARRNSLHESRTYPQIARVFFFDGSGHWG